MSDTTTLDVTVNDKCPHAVVIAGKKVPLGTVGEVFWFAPSKWGRGYCAGFRYDDGQRWIKIFMNADDLERIPSIDELKAHKEALEKVADAKLLADLDGDVGNYEEARLAMREVEEDEHQRILKQEQALEQDAGRAEMVEVGSGL